MGRRKSFPLQRAMKPSGQTFGIMPILVAYCLGYTYGELAWTLNAEFKTVQGSKYVRRGRTRDIDGMSMMALFKVRSCHCCSSCNLTLVASFVAGLLSCGIATKHAEMRPRLRISDSGPKTIHLAAKVYF